MNGDLESRVFDLEKRLRELEKQQFDEQLQNKSIFDDFGRDIESLQVRTSDTNIKICRVEQEIARSNQIFGFVFIMVLVVAFVVWG